MERLEDEAMISAVMEHYNMNENNERSTFLQGSGKRGV
jgi:hypothetical protein